MAGDVRGAGAVAELCSGRGLGEPTLVLNVEQSKDGIGEIVGVPVDGFEDLDDPGLGDALMDVGNRLLPLGQGIFAYSVDSFFQGHG